MGYSNVLYHNYTLNTIALYRGSERETNLLRRTLSLQPFASHKIYKLSDIKKLFR